MVITTNHFIWTCCFHSKENDINGEWIAAEVPGAVQLDYARHHKWPDYWYGDEFRNYEWMENQYWTYRTTFTRPLLNKSERYLIHLGGVDYACLVRVNGVVLADHEGYATPVTIDVTTVLQDENCLDITLRPIPKAYPEPVDRGQAAESCKPTCSYGWDWHPRLVPIGLWKECVGHKASASFFSQAELRYDLQTVDSHYKAVCYSELAIDGESEGLVIHWTLESPDGAFIFDKIGTVQEARKWVSTLEQPELWWPRDQGSQACYKSCWKLSDSNGHVLDRREQQVGFRRVRLVMNGGAWDKPDVFPKSRSDAPITLEINGRRLFGMGSNLVPSEIFPGLVTDEREQQLVDSAFQAGFNLLRLWGGAGIHRDAFYERCDELGILVWQEFPLACNNYPDSPEYLDILQQEAVSMIRQLRGHPSIALWCGGNELFNAWSGMDDQSHALRLLNSLAFAEDKNTPFLPTAPVVGMGHGPYACVDTASGEDVLSLFSRSTHTAYTEFAVPGPAAVSTLKSFIPQDELWPPRIGTAWETHHGIGALPSIAVDSWLMHATIDSFFGTSQNLDELVAHGQILQSIGLQHIFEESRRQWPACSMAMNWCFNEPWPSAANNSLLSWPHEEKPALQAVAQACRASLLSARVRKLKWTTGEQFMCECFAINHSAETTDFGLVDLVLCIGAKEIPLLSWQAGALQAGTNKIGPHGSVCLPPDTPKQFTLHIRSACNSDYNNSYTFFCEPKIVDENGSRELNA